MTTPTLFPSDNTAQSAAVSCYLSAVSCYPHLHPHPPQTSGKPRPATNSADVHGKTADTESAREHGKADHPTDRSPPAGVQAPAGSQTVYAETAAAVSDRAAQLGAQHARGCARAMLDALVAGELAPDDVARWQPPASVPRAKKRSRPISPGLEKCPPCPHDDIVAAYHQALPTCPRVREWHEARKRKLRSLWRERVALGKFTTEADGVAYFRRYFAKVGRSPLLTGRVPGTADRPAWCADLEWLVTRSHFVRIVEGRYDDA